MASNSLVLVGAADWRHPAWRGRFYPADMPDDWLLSYYNSQFNAVYLPADIWQAASGASWAQWLHDTLDGFHFVLAPGDPDSAPPVSERVLMSTPSWEAAHVWWLDEGPDLRLLAQTITQHASTGEPLFVFSRSGNLELMERASTLVQVMGY